jgi:hypothetical protein
MPSGLIQQQERMLARRDLCGDFGQMQTHRLAVAVGQDQSGAFSVAGTDGAEDVGRSGALIGGSRGSCSAQGPAPRDLVLLADARLVREPDFEGVSCEALFVGDLRQARWELFLKASMAPSR